MDSKKAFIKEQLLWLPPYHRLLVTPAGITVEVTLKVDQAGAEIDTMLADFDPSQQWLVAYHQPGQPLTVTKGSIGFADPPAIREVNSSP